MDVSSNTNRRSLRDSIREFFYREQVPYSMAALRIVLPLVLLQTLIPRWFHARELFSSDGAAAPLAINYSMWGFPPEPGGTLAVALMTILIVALASAAVGWLTRPSLLIACGLYTYLTLLDCVSTMTKYSVISSHMLLLLALSPCGAVWSIDAWRQRRFQKGSMPQPPPAFPVWPQRLVQLFIGLVYFGAACTKMHTDAYFTSDQLRYWLMTNVNNHNPAGELLSFYPAIVIGMAHFAIVWQIVFIFIVWKPVVRWIVLAIGVMFHASTTPLLGLYVFPQVMIASYLTFADEAHVLRIRAFVRQLLASVDTSALAGFWNRLQPRLVLPAGAASGTVWLAVLLTSTVGGVAAESLYDPYGLRRPEGPYELKPIDADLNQRLMEPNPPIPFADRLLTFDASGDMLGGVLLHPQTTFRRGKRFFAQASLAPPHEDVWLTCQLRDTYGQIVHESGQIVPRERLRADWQFNFPAESTPGQYRLLLLHQHKVIAERTIDVR
ncbi:MAG: HTTM domain-containing protein [Planctomycetota bacterium]|jgi:hypothetical protein